MKQKPRIALVAVNSSHSHTNPALYCIKTLVKRKHGLPCRLIELTIKDDWRFALREMTGDRFSHYLFSVYVWNAEYVGKLVQAVKLIAPDSKVILGGPEISYNLAHWKKTVADVLVQGQAETFVDHLFQQEEGVVHSPSTPISLVPFPYDKEDYSCLKGRLVYYEASRGCRFSCSYCLSSRSDQQPEYKAIERVKEELLQLTSIEPKIVKLVDRSFNADARFAREIWRFLINLRPSVPFHFELHPGFLEDEDFELLADAPPGLFHFEVGIQSTNPNVLSAVHRPRFSEADGRSVRRLCAHKNIHTHLDQIVGLPRDTRETAIRTFKEILSFDPDEFQLGFLKVLPGTALARDAAGHELRYAPFPPYEILSTAALSFQDLKEFHLVEQDLNRFYNTGFFRHTLRFLMDSAESPWRFFQELAALAPAAKNMRQWTPLGESLLKYAEKKLAEERDYVIDLLRYDWCPYASSQSYPKFLHLEKQDRQVREIRRSLFTHISRERAITKSEYNHAILYMPATEKMSRQLDYGAILFYGKGNSKRVKFHKGRLEEGCSKRPKEHEVIRSLL